MKELKQMFWMILGVVAGFGLGALAFVHLMERFKSIAASPTLSLFIAVPVLGGGLIGGGYLAQILVEKYDRAKRRKAKALKEQAPFRQKKKKK